MTTEMRVNAGQTRWSTSVGSASTTESSRPQAASVPTSSSPRHSMRSRARHQAQRLAPPKSRSAHGQDRCLTRRFAVWDVTPLSPGSCSTLSLCRSTSDAAPEQFRCISDRPSWSAIAAASLKGAIDLSHGRRRTTSCTGLRAAEQR